MGSWDKFYLLMWKNYKLQLRKPISFTVEVGLPLLIVGLLLFLRDEIDCEEVKEEHYDHLNISENPYVISAYSPNNSFINKIMEDCCPKAVGFHTGREMENFMQNNEPMYCGIQFDDDISDSNFKGNINIQLRYYSAKDWKTDALYPGFSIASNPRSDYLDAGGPPYYHNEKFDSVMYRLSSSIFKLHLKKPLPNIVIQRFSYPSHEYDNLISLMGTTFLFGIMFTTIFLYACSNMVKSITLEKEKQLKESMKIMGLPTWLHWTAWFFQMFVPLLIVVIVMSIAMKLYIGDAAILKYSDVTLLFVFFLFYSIQVITFSFAISVFFSKANRAASLSGLIWFLGLVPYIIIRCGDYTNISTFMKYFTSLFAPSAVSYGFDVILLFETRKTGAQWSNLFKSNRENGITLGGIMLMMLFDIFAYLCITLYVEQIFPGEFGVPQKWYFIFTREFWCGGETDSMGYDRQSTIKGDYFEEEPSNLKAGIKIEHLCKTFGANDAVKNVSMNLYEDQITVLLGHNGAGKTTTMSMLTGMFPPTKGTATINGYDIRTQIMKVRDSMGICPQHNVLFDDLTVREHLIFFSRLKGCRGDQVEVEVKKFLKLLSLEDKADAKSSELSGGMKRKLSVGIALCGNSKVIMLDEPTAGMDPSARRFIWEFLQEEKKGRTILLTTHFMDEADLLGDRIAIMSGGELKCCGSSFFLKKKYGAGYHLVIDQLPSCKPNVITRLLGEYIPGIHIESNAGTELTYLLAEKYSATFPRLLSELEENSMTLGIRSFGISLTDLEEVFMKVGTNESGRMITKEEDNHTVEGYTNVTINSTYLETGASLYKNQIRAMFLKKYLVVIRSWLTEILKTVLPVIYIILLVYAAAGTKIIKDQTSRSFSLADYDNSKTFVENTQGNEGYLDLLKQQNQEYVIVESVDEAVLNQTKEDPSSVKYTYVIGASFTGTPTAWFSNEPYHALPLSLQMMINSFVEDKTLQLNFINHPIPKLKTDEDQMIEDLTKSIDTLIAVSVSIAFIGCFYILFNIRERICQAKHLQFVSGVNVFIFWFVSFIVDIATYIISSAAIVITFSILQPHGLSTFQSLSYLFLLLLDCGIALMPFMYMFSFFFTIPSTGFARMFFISFAAGLPAWLLIYILKMTDNTYAIYQWILRIIPPYVLTEGIGNLMHITTKSSSTNTAPTNSNLISFDEDGLGIGILSSYISFILYFCLVFLIEFKMISNWIFSLSAGKIGPKPPSFIDEDVKNENDNVRNGSIPQLLDQNVLVLKDLTKKFKNLTAVNGLNLMVKKSECFGLLGVNGAGKTTTFRMMTGDERISYGDGWIHRFSIKSQMKKVQRCIGYCPQFDALIDNLTARETLKIFSLIRGVPREECDFTAERLARDFDFSQHLDKQVNQLSGGNKRKLSTAIALIGDAPIIFLDEPSTGMDPATKRHLWNRLSSIRERGKSIILTSHSMEECEALCTRLAIMVNGNFQCLGSIQHLKSRFSEGFSITLKIKKIKNSSGMEHRDTTQIEQFMAHNFRGCELREKHQELLNYYIKDKTAKWSTLFGILERAKMELDIEDYSICQASLEQVFLTFTKGQKSDDELIKPKKRACCGLCWC